jgi:surface antigen
MPIFTPRTKAPSASDLNWIHYTKGGNNRCLRITEKSVLPNCVGYAWGRWQELVRPVDNKLSRGNAENWWEKDDGYRRGQTPKLGAIVCWRKGLAGVASDGAGHVAVVEDILADGSIVTSNSAYGGSLFYTRRIRPPYSVGGSYVFQGFIYPPVEFTKKPVITLKSTDVIAREVIAGKWHNGLARKNALTAAGYDYYIIQARVRALLKK